MNESIKSSTESVTSDYNVGHPTTKPIAEDIEFLPSTIAKDAVGSSQSSKLEPNDVEFFKIHGYLIKRRFLSEQTDAFQTATDHFWANVPNHALRQNDPESWLDNPQSHWRQEDHVRVGSLINTNWKMRSRGENGIGTESFLVDRLANHPKMLRLASEFLGATIKQVQRVRGIYGVFPIADRSHDRMYPHGDYMASHLSAMVLIGEYILDYKVSRIGSKYYTVTHEAREPSAKKASATGASGRGGAFALVTPTIRQKAACFVNRYVSPY